MKRTPLRRISTLKRRRIALKAGKPKSDNEQLDQLVRQIVLVRDNWKCRRCQKRTTPGRGGGLEVAHLYPKGSYPALRHELMNVMLLCHRCHFYWWHKNPMEAREWLVETFGAAWVEALRLMARTRSKVDKQAVRIFLENCLRQSEGKR